MKKPLAIGVDNYKSIIERDSYYVDKTLFIKELLDKHGEVSLFTRPRRFGKTLALSMIRTYFELEYSETGEILDNRKYFEEKKIMEAGERYTSEMGQYPVIAVSLKSARQPSYAMAYDSLIDEIAKEYDRHSYILNGQALSEAERIKFQSILNGEAKEIDYAKSLEYLSYCLEKFHRKQTIILIDEYDVPLETAYFRGYYSEMIDFIRSLFESALKSNESLKFAVITGCLRISKESIFTGLNNLQIISILNQNYAEYFGFTQLEVEKMLEFYGLEEKKEEVKHWYDGYLFGNTEVYNPWSMVNYVYTAVTEMIAYPKPYWSNTSSNSIIRELIETANSEMKEEIENLVSGGSIEKPVHEEITYEDIHRTQDNLWNFLFFTGYLKVRSQRFENRQIFLTLMIPNEEVKYIYENTIREWFQEKMNHRDAAHLYQAILEEREGDIETEIRSVLQTSISYNDSNESFYHGIMIGLLQGFSDYRIKSNRESGNGRPDMVLIPLDERKPLYIMEFKYTKRFSDMEEKCRAALKQIDEQKYEAEYMDEGYRDIRKLAICFCKKSCIVKKR